MALPAFSNRLTIPKCCKDLVVVETVVLTETADLLTRPSLLFGGFVERFYANGKFRVVPNFVTKSITIKYMSRIYAIFQFSKGWGIISDTDQSYPVIQT